jgi:hypothetical protein
VGEGYSSWRSWLWRFFSLVTVFYIFKRRKNGPKHVAEKIIYNNNSVCKLSASAFCLAYFSACLKHW